MEGGEVKMVTTKESREKKRPESKYSRSRDNRPLLPWTEERERERERKGKRKHKSKLANQPTESNAKTSFFSLFVSFSSSFVCLFICFYMDGHFGPFGVVAHVSMLHENTI